MNFSDPNAVTQDLLGSATRPEHAASSIHPACIGRYRIEKALGSGGFGLVFLAHDEQLNRRVAVKVPHTSLVSRAEDAGAYLAEARTVASLDHPNIAPVHDVGATSEFPCYVVSKYVKGTDLSTRLSERRPTYTEAAELVATVAEALHYAHKQGVVHRDIKPGNILIDSDGKPYVVDFGLALREENIGKGPRYVGTPAYMSPEQARGEGHRVDGRSDIFSLGVVLYELLVGCRPFRGDSQAEVLEHVTNHEPRPLRQCDEKVPTELERICHGAMAKRATERYSSAHDLAEDLRQFVSEQKLLASTAAQGTTSTASKTATSTTALAAGTSTASAADSIDASTDQRPIKIVPKGLRSFDAHDADFFLELLPGPRDRDGLPDSLRFWKTRIEETDPDQTFSVGLIYGPSGCGKSSLVKAGLLPRLSEDVCAVYIEATPEGTESQLAQLIGKRCPDLEHDLGLKETLAAVRKGRGIPNGKKLLIVIDQFEQWLHFHHDVGSTELVRALRQCDGGRLQCIVMVRDDFWLSVSRFMRDLEVSHVDGQNSAVADLCDEHHARKVLAAFGVAYGKLPDRADQIPQVQREFLKQAVAELANDGRVVCVRLALFADMMKSKPWTTSGLRNVGGAIGVGESFLEDTFSTSTASPEYRHHQTAARAVLKALLPKSGTDIKGQRKSWDELLQASGYAGRPGDFQELIEILDSKLRLISPVDMAGLASTEDCESRPDNSRNCYQLTHDYLVHSLREWLNRKQKETRRGRAEIRLAERSALWKARPEPRQLPTCWEYLSIRLFTDSNQWGAEERMLLGSARRHHMVRLGGCLGLLIVGAITLWQVFASVHTRQIQTEKKIQEQAAMNRAVTLVHQLRGADTGSVPTILAELQPWLPWADSFLKESFQRASEGSTEKLHLALALIHTDRDGVGYLTELLPELEEAQFAIVHDALLPYKEEVAQTLWRGLDNVQFDERTLLPTAIALAAYTPDDIRWNRIAPSVVKQLTKVASPEQYLRELAPVEHLLVDPLRKSVHDASMPLAERRRAATALCAILDDKQQIAEGLPGILVEWILETGETDEFLRVLRALRPHSYGVQQQMRATLEKPLETTTLERRASAAAALFHFGDADYVWPLLRHAPNLSLRSLLIDRLARLSVSHQLLVDQLAQEVDASVRQAIVLVLGGSSEELSAGQKQEVAELLERLYAEDSDAGVHSAVNWTLRQWDMESKLEKCDFDLSQKYDPDFGGERDWTVNSVGQTYIRIAQPTEFLMGDASDTEPLRPTQINYGFAIAAHEVTVAEFRAFRKEHKHDINFAPELNCPVNNVSWYDAVAFCNWLSDKEGLPRCYEPNTASEYAAGVHIPNDILYRIGYRLPTEAEWECFCRANTITRYSFGDAADLLGKYAWHQKNSGNRTWPVGSRLPNTWGAFDTHGNLWEWCQDLERIADRATDRVASDYNARLLCGGAFDNLESRVQSGNRLVHFPQEYKYSYGFRPVRTLPPTVGK